MIYFVEICANSNIIILYKPLIYQSIGMCECLFSRHSIACDPQTNQTNVVYKILRCVSAAVWLSAQKAAARLHAMYIVFVTKYGRIQNKHENKKKIVPRIHIHSSVFSAKHREKKALPNYIQIQKKILSCARGMSNDSE